MDQTMSLLVVNGIISWALEAIKRSRWFPWITGETEKLNHLASAVAATLLAAGIGISSSWDSSSATYVLTLSGLTATNVFNFVSTAVGNYMLQKGWFKVLFTKTTA